MIKTVAEVLKCLNILMTSKIMRHILTNHKIKIKEIYKVEIFNLMALIKLIRKSQI